MAAKLTSMIGMAKKAGQLTAGTDLCREMIRRGKSKLIIIAEDASENTKKRLQDSCTHYGTTAIRPQGLTMEELSRALGLQRLCSAVSINSEDFKNAIMNTI